MKSKESIYGELVGILISWAIDIGVAAYLGKRFGLEVGVVCAFVLLGISQLSRSLLAIKEKLGA